MEAWILITVCAAFFQNIRTALQKYLKGRLSTGGATYVRFIFGFPFALVYIVFLVKGSGYTLPTVNVEFTAYVIIGGLAQIIATALLVALFSLKNFAVGTTYSKTETVQAAIFGLVLLGDALSTAAVIAITISFVGIILISASGAHLTAKEVLLGWTGKPALYGLLSGGFFGVSAVAYRAGALALSGEDAFISAAMTLVCVLGFQTVVMTVYLVFFEKGQLQAVMKAWKVAIWVGVTGMAGSVGWFTAMAMQNAAYVRAVGQIELVFTFIISYFYFKEKTNKVEAAGILLIVFGILIFVLK
ncbi:DMT family transporter [Sneathiella aquimaris]|uniref:DMT family transporter n=1 Tax=Sneathiella aquimaris TaxID=2599305 RepID=UPI00146E4D25|nr:DMT family transporter [Sneathiella aquimaris]